MRVHKIIKGIFVEDFYDYTFSNDPNSLYFTEKGAIFVRNVSEYDDTGNLIKFSVYKSEGVLEYSIDDLMKDTLLFQFTSGGSVKDLVFIDNNNIAYNRDTLKIETTKNYLGLNVYINRKGSSITIFE
jgi:hypothetical protein